MSSKPTVGDCVVHLEGGKPMAMAIVLAVEQDTVVCQQRNNTLRLKQGQYSLSLPLTQNSPVTAGGKCGIVIRARKLVGGGQEVFVKWENGNPSSWLSLDKIDTVHAVMRKYAIRQKQGKINFFKDVTLPIDIDQALYRTAKLSTTAPVAHQGWAITRK